MKQETDQNLISVIICTFNRSKSLAMALDSLLKLRSGTGFDYEIIIVDNNSTDATSAIVESYRTTFKKKLKYIFESRQGLSFARNKGIEESTGGIIVFTDDDVVVDSNWLMALYECFIAFDVDAIGGKVLPAYPERTPQWVRLNDDLLNGPIVLHDYGEKTRPYVAKEMVPFVGANMAFKRECFQGSVLFRTDLGMGQGAMGEDTEIFRRLERLEKKIVYCGSALVWHSVDPQRMNLNYVARWNIQSGRYFVKKSINPMHLVYWYGIPRYLLRECAEDAFSFLLNIFRTRKFIISWGRFFKNIGMCLEYRNREKTRKLTKSKDRKVSCHAQN